jgi:hypothetical protein
LPKVPRDYEYVFDYDNPKYYTYSSIEPSDAIMAWKLNWHLGNVVKYIVRAGLKGDTLHDLKKAKAYLEREIKRYEDGA